VDVIMDLSDRRPRQQLPDHVRSWTSRTCAPRSRILWFPSTAIPGPRPRTDRSREKPRTRVAGVRRRAFSATTCASRSCCASRRRCAR
jgi:hypothetical protein